MSVLKSSNGIEKKNWLSGVKAAPFVRNKKYPNDVNVIFKTINYCNNYVHIYNIIYLFFISVIIKK